MFPGQRIQMPKITSSESLYFVPFPSDYTTMLGSLLCVNGSLFWLVAQSMAAIVQKQYCPGPWPGSSLGESIVPLPQGLGFDPHSGHTRESTNECINKWNNKSMFLSLSLPPFLSLSLKSIKTNKNNWPDLEWCCLPT